jgi:glutamate--cysteine ligase
LELELPIVNEKNEPVNFEVIYQVTDRFIDTFSFLNVSRDDNEHIYLAVDDKTGDGLSYDCSYNTLKISFGKEEDMNVLYKRFCQYYTYIQKELRK